MLPISLPHHHPSTAFCDSAFYYPSHQPMPGMLIPVIIQRLYPSCSSPMFHVSSARYNSQNVSIILFRIFTPRLLHCCHQHVLDLPADLIHRVPLQETQLSASNHNRVFLSYFCPFSRQNLTTYNTGLLKHL